MVPGAFPSTGSTGTSIASFGSNNPKQLVSLTSSVLCLPSSFGHRVLSMEPPPTFARPSSGDLAQCFSANRKEAAKEAVLLALRRWEQEQGPDFSSDLKLFRQAKGQRLMPNKQRVILWEFAFGVIEDIRTSGLSTPCGRPVSRSEIKEYLGRAAPWFRAGAIVLATLREIGPASTTPDRAVVERLESDVTEKEKIFVDFMEERLRARATVSAHPTVPIAPPLPNPSQSPEPGGGDLRELFTSPGQAGTPSRLPSGIGTKQLERPRRSPRQIQGRISKPISRTKCRPGTSAPSKRGGPSDSRFWTWAER
ncbi:hypothetical protein BKA70DRAFT_1442806 [Coprinopsis sp. MPI-PUGE-AT-0042]|nr:hypothetical protein BKA70DRAFT_1442806 [Coprinopsis sp. MPI-PUGE-AT-0042]